MTAPQHPARPDPSLSVDDAWIAEWAAEGQRRIDRLLALHAAFERYLDERDASVSGDRGDPDRRIDRD